MSPPWNIDEPAENRRSRGDTGQDGVRIAILQAEPLPSIGRHVAGKRRMRRDELGRRQRLAPETGELDQIVAIGAESMQEDDERTRTPAGDGTDARPF